MDASSSNVQIPLFYPSSSSSEDEGETTPFFVSKFPVRPYGKLCLPPRARFIMIRNFQKVPGVRAWVILPQSTG